MLFHKLKRSFAIFAIVEAVKKCNDPMFFFRLLARPEHLKPKIGEVSSSGTGEAFSNPIKKMAREETAHYCVFCTTLTSTSAPTRFSKRSAIDHAIPKSRGGANTLGNAQNTCYPCNSEKAARTTEQYLIEKFGPKGLQLIRRASDPKR